MNVRRRATSQRAGRRRRNARAPTSVGGRVPGSTLRGLSRCVCRSCVWRARRAQAGWTKGTSWSPTWMRRSRPRRDALDAEPRRAGGHLVSEKNVFEDGVIRIGRALGGSVASRGSVHGGCSSLDLGCQDDTRRDERNTQNQTDTPGPRQVSGVSDGVFDQEVGRGRNDDRDPDHDDLAKQREVAH